MAAVLPTTKLTFEQFLDWMDEDTLAEWVDGEVLMTSPASDPHQSILRFLSALISHVVEADDLGVLFPAPFLVRLPFPLQRAREPDLIFLARAHLDRLRHTYLDGAPDMIVEIVSPESRARDRGDKYAEYEEARVPEYWLLDPERRWAEFYWLNADGRYEVSMAGATGVYVSPQLPRLRLRVEWLWQRPMPKLQGVLRELDLL